jgi:hypothetical protein
MENTHKTALTIDKARGKRGTADVSTSGWPEVRPFSLRSSTGRCRRVTSTPVG